jgi:hypothetical protein
VLNCPTVPAYWDRFEPKSSAPQGRAITARFDLVLIRIDLDLHRPRDPGID